jgi:hypothetical protein
MTPAIYVAKLIRIPPEPHVAMDRYPHERVPPVVPPGWAR